MLVLSKYYESMFIRRLWSFSTLAINYVLIYLFLLWFACDNNHDVRDGEGSKLSRNDSLGVCKSTSFFVPFITTSTCLPISILVKFEKSFHEELLTVMHTINQKWWPYLHKLINMKYCNIISFEIKWSHIWFDFLRPSQERPSSYALYFMQ